MTRGNKTRLLVVSAVVTCLPAPTLACGFGPGAAAIFFAILGAALAVPLTVAVAGLVAAIRMRTRGGPTLGKGLLTGMAVAMEGLLAATVGWSSLLGLACLACVLIQAVLVAFAVLDPHRGPMPGVLTALADPSLFAGVPH